MSSKFGSPLRSALACLALASLAACASGPERPEGAWIAVETGTLQFQEPYPTMIFDPDDNEISGSGGCNRYRGDLMESDGAFTISKLVATEMACPPGVMEQETLFLSLLRDTVTADNSELGRLVLRTVDGRSLVFRSAAPQ